jgi:hypothetical protein
MERLFDVFVSAIEQSKSNVKAIKYVLESGFFAWDSWDNGVFSVFDK